MRTEKHHVRVAETDGDALLCGEDSFVALMTADRHSCSKCERRVGDLIHALRQVANQADWSGYDKQTVRALKYVFEKASGD